MIMTAWSSACERNKDPILAYLRQWLKSGDHVLEIGSGSAQHAQYFTQAISGLTWQCSECPEALADLAACLDGRLSEVLLPALSLDVNAAWPEELYQAVFTANTLHIMDWPSVLSFLAAAPDRLEVGGHLIVYGPFKYADRYTSASNLEFDQWLRQRDEHSGIRDLQEISRILLNKGMVQLDDVDMPVNNQLLRWVKQE